VISPLLSNLYMRRFVLGWKKLGYEERWKAYIVNYADDLVICCRTGAEQALATMREMMSKLRLTVNDSKTRVCVLPEEKFDFLGYTFGQCYSPKTGRAYLGTTPARKRVQRICGEIRGMTGRSTTSLDPATIVAQLNRMMNGWANYFCLGPVSTAYRAVDSYAKTRLHLWLRTKHKLSGRANGMFPDTHLYGALGLVRLDRRTRNFPWAKRESSPRAGCGRSACPVR
jgi:RNA-directed DNA polymerase